MGRTSGGAGGGGSTPGGSDTQVQFNDGGSLGGDAGLTYDKTTDRLTAGSAVIPVIYNTDASNSLNLASGRLAVSSGGMDVIYDSSLGAFTTSLKPVTNAHDLVIGNVPASTFDLVPGTIGLYGLPAQAAAATNLDGGSTVVRGGDGASGSAGDADGGNVLLDGGRAYGTGDDGQVVVGATRGSLRLAAGGTKPTAGAAFRGTFWYTPGAGGVADKIEICAKSAADTYSWVALSTLIV